MDRSLHLGVLSGLACCLVSAEALGNSNPFDVAPDVSIFRELPTEQEPNPPSLRTAQGSTAGDVNGDGFSDLMIYQEEYLYLFFGGPQGIAGTLPEASGSTGQTIVFSDPTGTAPLFGSAAAPAGDIDNDGYDDIVVGGAILGDSVVVFYGSVNGLKTNPQESTTIYGPDVVGPNTAEGFGLAVSTAGYFNDDEYADIVVGAPNAASSNRPHRGAAYVFLGSASGISTTHTYVIAGDDNERLGTSVGHVGRLDPEVHNTDSIIVGAPGVRDRGLGTQPDPNVSLLSIDSTNNDLITQRFYSSSLGIYDPPFDPMDPPEYPVIPSFGTDVAGAGDMNGDGKAEILVSGADTHFFKVPVLGGNLHGAVYLYEYDASTDPPELVPVGDVLYPYFAQNVALAFRFGNVVSPAGDLNGDGLADIAIGCEVYNEPTLDCLPSPAPCVSGGFATYLGHPATTISQIKINLTTQTTTHVSEGVTRFFDFDDRDVFPYAGTRFASSVRAAGDLNGDGIGDVVANAPEYRRPSEPKAQFDGAIFVFYGKRRALVDDPRSYSWSLPGAPFGAERASHGDLNGDGLSDLAVMSNSQREILIGHVSVDDAQFNSDRPYIAEEPLPSTSETSRAISFVGDVDEDGYADVGEITDASVIVWFGGADGFDGESWSFPKSIPTISAITGGKDVSGDGVPDVVVSMFDSVTGSRVEVFAGNRGSRELARVFTLTEEDLAVDLSVNPARRVTVDGDYDGDGTYDIVVSAAADDRCFVVWGGSWNSPTSAFSHTEIPSPGASGTSFGEAVVALADANGDGFSDLVVREFGDPDGALHLFLGGPARQDLVSADWDFTLTNYDPSLWKVASVGDLNRDGLSDLALVRNDPMSAFSVFWGSDAPFSSAPDIVRELGVGVREAFPAGDPDGDGFVDVVTLEDNEIGIDGLRLFRMEDPLRGSEGSLNEVQARQTIFYRPTQSRVGGSGTVGQGALAGDTNALFGLSAWTAEGALGARVRMELQVAEFDASFDSTPTVTTNWQRLPTSIDLLDLMGTGPENAIDRLERIQIQHTEVAPPKELKWRARIASRNPYFPHSDWFSLAGTPTSDVDLRIETVPEPSQIFVTLNNEANGDDRCFYDTPDVRQWKFRYVAGGDTLIAEAVVIQNSTTPLENVLVRARVVQEINPSVEGAFCVCDEEGITTLVGSDPYYPTNDSHISEQFGVTNEAGIAEFVWEYIGGYGQAAFIVDLPQYPAVARAVQLFDHTAPDMDASCQEVGSAVGVVDFGIVANHMSQTEYWKWADYDCSGPGGLISLDFGFFGGDLSGPNCSTP